MRRRSFEAAGEFFQRGKQGGFLNFINVILDKEDAMSLRISGGIGSLDTQKGSIIIFKRRAGALRFRTNQSAAEFRG